MMMDFPAQKHAAEASAYSAAIAELSLEQE